MSVPSEERMGICWLGSEKGMSRATTFVSKSEVKENIWVLSWRRKMEEETFGYKA